MSRGPATPTSAQDALPTLEASTPLSTRLGLAVSVWFMSLIAATVTLALLIALGFLLLSAYYGTNDDRGVLAAVLFFGAACGAGGRLLLAMCASHVTNESRGHISASAMVVGCGLGYAVVFVLMHAWPAFQRLSWLALLLPLGFAATASYVPWRGTATSVFCAVGIVGALVTAYSSLVG